MPIKVVVPITTPVKITFPDKTELWTIVDPDTGQHSVQCDLCGKNLKAGYEDLEIQSLVIGMEETVRNR